MSVNDAVVCWILALPSVAVFFLAYSVLEDMIKKTWAPRRSLDQPKLVDAYPPARVQVICEPPPQVRGYDSPALFREDTLIRLREIYRQVSHHELNIQGIL